MSYTTITTTEIASGKPVSTSTLTKVKDNLDDHETRILGLEAGTSVPYPPIIFRVNGTFAQSRAIDGLLETTNNFSIQITGVRIWAQKAGSSGTYDIDIVHQFNGSGFVSCLSTRPTLAYTTGDEAASTNAVINSGNATIVAGSNIRLVVYGLQVGGNNFYVRVDYDKV
jgi:hypothetical protein